MSKDTVWSFGSKGTLWTNLRRKESQAIADWLPEMESTAENILKHYEDNTTVPWVFDNNSVPDVLSDDNYHYVHIWRTFLKKDPRLKYLIKQPGNQEIFCPINLHAAEFGTAPIASENKIEISDKNADYINYVFHLAGWFTQFELYRLTLTENRSPWFDVVEIPCLLQKPFFKTELDIQPYTIDKVFYDVLGFMKSMGKITVEEVSKPSYKQVFKLSSSYKRYLLDKMGPSRMYKMTGKIMVEDKDVLKSWLRWISFFLARDKNEANEKYLGESSASSKEKDHEKDHENNHPNKKQCASGDDCIKTAGELN